MTTMQAPDRTIASPHNDRVKYVVRLRDRRHRDRAAAMIVEGYRELRRALSAGYRASEVWYCPELFLGSNEAELLALARGAGAQLVATDERVFRKLSYRDRPDGLLAVGPLLRRDLEILAPRDPALVVIAEAIEKPGNLGTILRSADGCGASAVIVCDPTTDVCNPNVVRASVGTLFTVPIAEADTAATLSWLQAQRIPLVAATPAGTLPLWAADLRQPVAIAVGSEQYGLSEALLGAAAVRVRIPMQGAADSLNVATATTILLYEAMRQRLNR